MDTITQAFDELTQQALALGNTVFIIGLGLSIVPYILFAIGLYSVAGRYRIRNKWMAWVPIARKHLLAEVADFRRFQVRKPKKLETQFEIITGLLMVCIFGATRTTGPLFSIIAVILIVILSFNQVFSYYYFYRLCDRENATIYFLLGLAISPLNSIFVYHCR